MSRRKKLYHGAIPGGDKHMMERAILKLWNRRLNAQAKPEVSHQEVFEMFVPEKHRQLARDAVSILGAGASTKHYVEVANLRKASIEFRIIEGDWFINAATKKMKFEQLPASLKAWLDWRLKAADEFGLIGAVLNALDDLCDDMQTVRFFWPAVPFLLDHSGMGATADQYREFKPVRNPPALHHELRKACMTTMHTLTKAAMYPERDDDDDVIKDGTAVVIGIRSYDRGKRPWDNGLLDPM
jgi:hypothetical protein